MALTCVGNVFVCCGKMEEKRREERREEGEGVRFHPPHIRCACTWAMHAKNTAYLSVPLFLSLVFFFI